MEQTPLRGEGRRTARVHRTWPIPTDTGIHRSAIVSTVRAPRFVTLCFVYSGLVLPDQSITVYRYSFDIAGLARLGVALSIAATGLYRLWNTEVEADTPAAYGLFTYGMAALAFFLTGIFLGQFLLLRVGSFLPRLPSLERTSGGRSG